MAKKFELQIVSEVSDIQCPHCNEVIEEIQNSHWDFMDGETRLVVCKHCKKKYQVVINRPIEFVVGRKEDF